MRHGYPPREVLGENRGLAALAVVLLGEARQTIFTFWLLAVARAGVVCRDGELQAQQEKKTGPGSHGAQSRVIGAIIRPELRK